METTAFEETYRANLHSAEAVEPTPRTLQMSAYLTPQNGEAGNYFVGTTFKRNDSDNLWHADPALYWPVGGTMNFLAYSVTTEIEGPGAGKGITVAWNEENAAEQVVLTVPGENTQNDILYASTYGTQSKTQSSPVNMVFNHAQAWLEFVLTGAEDASGQPVVHFKSIDGGSLAAAVENAERSVSDRQAGIRDYTYSELGRMIKQLEMLGKNNGD